MSALVKFVLLLAGIWLVIWFVLTYLIPAFADIGSSIGGLIGVAIFIGGGLFGLWIISKAMDKLE